MTAATVSFPFRRVRRSAVFLSYLNEMCIPVSTVPNLSALRSAARGDLVVSRTRLVRSPGTVSQCTFDPYLHYQRSYIINVKNMLKTHLLAFLLYWLTVFTLRAANTVRRPCSDSSHVTAPYKLPFYYYYYYSISGYKVALLLSCHVTPISYKGNESLAI